MPWIIDYDVVLAQMHAQHFKCLYYNSGAFGFPESAGAQSLAWVGPPDDTLRPAARPLTRQIPPPHPRTLAALASRFWREHLPGRVWVMPMSHWAFELSHGSHEWLPAVVEHIGLDPGLLEGRNNAAPLEFSPHEGPAFERLIERLLEMLRGSDFTLAFPGKPIVCLLHHHQQLWWTTTDGTLLAAVEKMAAEASARP